MADAINSRSGASFLPPANVYYEFVVFDSTMFDRRGRKKKKKKKNRSASSNAWFVDESTTSGREI